METELKATTGQLAEVRAFTGIAPTEGPRNIGGAVHRDDSDDELGDEDLPWEWIYEEMPIIPTTESLKSAPTPKKRGRKGKADATAVKTARQIVGARMGKFECRMGDTVLLKADAKEAWVALICSFWEDEQNDNEKMGNFMWFCSTREIRDKNKRESNYDNELFITPTWDDNPLTAINGTAKIVSPRVFNATYPSGKVPKTDPGFGKTFVCRLGCNTRTGKYSQEFVWEDFGQGRELLPGLIQLVQSQTLVETKPRMSIAEKIEKAKQRMSLPRKKPPPLKNLSQAGSDSDPFITSGAASARSKKGSQTPRKRAKEEDHDFRASASEAEGFQTPRKRQRTVEPMSASRKAGGTTPRKLLSTPTSKRTIVRRPLEFTPLGSRILSTNALQSPFQQARNQLHVSSVPMTLPCREDEFATVYTHLETAITEGSGSCIYIAGTPGTGKTATVREVVAQLNAAVMDEELEDFIFVEINGMKVTDPHQAYSLLWEALRGERVSHGQALRLLETEFSTPSPRRVPCVVLMDELDQLVTKDQSVMYNFFNWPGLKHSRLIVLAVANTMDLPERTLSNKISSRLGLHRITFRGYTHEQLMEIIESRLSNVPGNLVHPDAVQFAARKVAAVSGDARRALDICRRAVEIAEETQLNKIKAEEAERQREAEAEADAFIMQRHEVSVIHELDEDEPEAAQKHLDELKRKAGARHKPQRIGNPSDMLSVPATPSRGRVLSTPSTPSGGGVGIISMPSTPIQMTPLHKRAALPAIPGIVTIATIKQAITEATSSPLQQSLRALPLTAKVFLAALIALSRRSGIQEAVLGDVLDEALKMAKNMLGPVMTSGPGAAGGVVHLVVSLDDSFAAPYDDEELENIPAPFAVNGGLDGGVGTVGTVVPQTPSTRRRGARAKKQTTQYLPRLLGMKSATQQLVDAGLIGVETRRGERVGRVRLSISEEEVGLALRGDVELVGLNLTFLTG